MTPNPSMHRTRCSGLGPLPRADAPVNGTLAWKPMRRVGALIAFLVLGAAAYGQTFPEPRTYVGPPRPCPSGVDKDHAFVAHDHRRIDHVGLVELVCVLNGSEKNVDSLSRDARPRRV